MGAADPTGGVAAGIAALALGGVATASFVEPDACGAAAVFFDRMISLDARGPASSVRPPHPPSREA